ncbi:MAG TPA: sugar ABC transporter permease [bacterium]|nr:sugar ABC transporter permease [bacterium]
MTDSKPGASVPWRALTMVGALLAIWLIFSITTGGTFLSARNLSLLMRQMAVTGILASGMVLVIVAGQIDLSVGAMTGFLGALSALLFVDFHWPLAFAVAAALAAGALFGHLQGHLVTWFNLPPFIVTLGGMLVFQGSLLGMTGGVAISPTPDYLAVGQAFLPLSLGWGLTGLLAAFFLWRAARETKGARLQWLGWAALATAFTGVLSAYEGIPLPVLILLGLTGLLALVARQTPFGRHLYAIGGNREAAFYSGINIQRHLVLVFTLMGALAGVAGVVLTARVGAATSDAGHMMELDAIAAAVIGGTSLMGGRGSVWGALLGALVMASLDNGMGLMNTEAFWQPILKGSILILAVSADMAGSRKN